MSHFSDLNLGENYKITKIIRNKFSDEIENIEFMTLLVLLYCRLLVFYYYFVIYINLFCLSSGNIVVSICNQMTHCDTI